MVKGTTRRVIVIKTPDPRLFEEAIFIVREDALRDGGVTGDDIIRQACEVADNYVRNNIKKKKFAKLPAPVFAFFGSAVTAIIWLAARLII